MNHHKKKTISSLIKPSTPDHAETVRVQNRSQLRGRMTAGNGDTSVFGKIITYLFSFNNY